MKDNRIIAEKIRDIINDISPVIDEYTGKICPYCSDVCCKQKHAYPEKRDILYLEALGIEPCAVDMNRSPESPCQFLGENGCTKPRYLRPIRCTWYFCESLLKEMENGSQKKYRYLIDNLKEIIELLNKITTDDVEIKKEEVYGRIYTQD